MRIVPGSIVGLAADKKHGMTLGELAAFVQAAYQANASPDARVGCTATWRNSIKRLEVQQGLSPEQEVTNANQE